MAKDPKVLRERAKQLIDEAKRIENERAIRIGKYMLRYAESGFKGMSIEKMREDIERL